MYMIEYSVSQKAFNINTLPLMLTVNLKNAILEGENDYQVVGMAKTHELAQEYVRDLKIKYKEFRK